MFFFFRLYWFCEPLVMFLSLWPFLEAFWGFIRLFFLSAPGCGKSFHKGMDRAGALGCTLPNKALARLRADGLDQLECLLTITYSTTY